MILVIARRRQTEQARECNQGMKRPRIAIIGDTWLRGGEWTNAAVIAIEASGRWKADVGLRSVASSTKAERLLRTRLESAGVATWLTVRNDIHDSEASTVRADVRMGDPLHIPHLFDHDVIILACRDVRLRRFLADLPVHTRPDVRIVACLNVEGVPMIGEQLEDLLRFDTLIGSEQDFQELNRSLGGESRPHVLGPVHQRMHGSNLRAAIAWNARGLFSLAEPHRPILSIASKATSYEPVPASWPAIVAAVAVGIARRDPWHEIGRAASNATARRSYT